MTASPLFDHEKLDVYQLELEFLRWASVLIDDISKSAREHRAELIQQLDRASLSVLLNTAEGNAKRHGKQRAKFLDDARGSAMECAACLDASVAKRFVPNERIQPGKATLARIASMLTRLVNRFDTKTASVRAA
jgi:four helix bundle protein